MCDCQRKLGKLDAVNGSYIGCKIYDRLQVMLSIEAGVFRLDDFVLFESLSEKDR